MRNDTNLDHLIPLIPEFNTLPSHIRDRLALESIVYSLLYLRLGNYWFSVQRESEIWSLLIRDEMLKLPEDLDYFAVHGLSSEEKLLLQKARPGTLGAAKRMQGITPVAILELVRYTKKLKWARLTPPTEQNEVLTKVASDVVEA